MVESAFEFAKICRDMDYHNFLFSMKASNPLVMAQAYRLLSEEQYTHGWDYPLHLGVTEVTHLQVSTPMSYDSRAKLEQAVVVHTLPSESLKPPSESLPEV